MNDNSVNPKVGKAFEEKTRLIAEKLYGMPFEEKAIEIGDPPHPHNFDLVSSDNIIIIECKCYTWTDGGNVPSAKLATLDEAVLYLRSICHPARLIIAMSYAYSEKRGITLAEYFCDKKGHLLDDISVWEIKDEDEIRVLR